MADLTDPLIIWYVLLEVLDRHRGGVPDGREGLPPIGYGARSARLKTQTVLFEGNGPTLTGSPTP